MQTSQGVVIHCTVLLKRSLLTSGYNNFAEALIWSQQMDFFGPHQRPCSFNCISLTSMFRTC